MSGTARRNLSPTWEYYLGMAVHAVLGILLRDGCACGALVKFGIHNVRRTQVTDI